MRSVCIEEYICCPVDKSYPLRVEEAEWNGEELRSGMLRCPTCGVGYAITEGIPHLLPHLDTQANVAWRAKLKEASARDIDAQAYDTTVPTYQTNVEINMLASAIQSKSRSVVLDLGAGTGRLTSALAMTGAHVLATDISYDSLKINRSKCAQVVGAAVDYLVADVCYLPIRDTIANSAGSGMLLEHIPTDIERRRFIEEVYRVLKPRGKFAFTAYNYSWAKRRHGDREGYHGGQLFYHRFYSNELRELLRRYHIHTITAILSRPSRLLQSQKLDRLIAFFPPIATITGTLLLAVAERRE